MMSVSITAFNFIIRAVNIWLVKLIRFHTISEELRMITFAIFVATFISTGFVLLMG
jgi:hypothetical protein